MAYSPILKTVEPVSGASPGTARPRWMRPSFGARFADAGEGVIVAVVVTSGPAASAGVSTGDRLVSIDGQPVVSARQAKDHLAASRSGVPSEWVVATGESPPRAIAILPAPSPVLPIESGGNPPDSWIAAFAAVDAASSERDAPAALANLALVLARAGPRDQALETWGRVRFGERSGIGPGTAAYYRGCLLETMGRGQEAAAREAFTRARDGNATAFDDNGPEVAPAAADHLADLGVGSN